MGDVSGTAGVARSFASLQRLPEVLYSISKPFRKAHKAMDIAGSATSIGSGASRAQEVNDEVRLVVSALAGRNPFEEVTTNANGKRDSR